MNAGDRGLSYVGVYGNIGFGASPEPVVNLFNLMLLDDRVDAIPPMFSRILISSTGYLKALFK